jgi:hypothetical protein
MMSNNVQILYATDSTRITLAKQCVAGRLIRITRGVYADESWYRSLDTREHYLETIKVCSAKYPEVIVAGRSAAVLHGLDILSLPEYPAKVDVIVPEGIRLKSDIMQLYRGRINNRTRSTGTSIINDSRCQSIVDALFFMLRNNSEAEAIVSLHSALRQQSRRAVFIMKKSRNFAFPLYSQEAFDICTELYSLIQKNEGIRGVQKAKRVLFLATDCAESPGESIALLYFHHFGLALPMINPTLLDTKGLFIGWVDFLWNCGGPRIDRRIRTDVMNGRYCRVLQGHVETGDTVIVEFDGKGKYNDEVMRRGRTDRTVLMSEKERENHIRRYGHGMLRIGWDEFYVPELLYEKLIEGGVPKKQYGHKNFDVLV